ncbi:MAG: hypothetical protein OEZ02_15705 [Anaerolineae bacterium]|nr:hypothetical protein [Anaerolineae bacterium]
MDGEVPALSFDTWIYIQSDVAYSHARTHGILEVIRGWIAGRSALAVSFKEATKDFGPIHAVYRGLQNIPLEHVVGSVGRASEFTRSFRPLIWLDRQKERWRISYTKTLSGGGYPAIEVYQVGREYFVVNGHHRVSLAKYFAWETIEAHVSEIGAA